MKINTFRYTPEDVACCYCAELRRCSSFGCCPWLQERIEAGAVSYEDVVAQVFHKNKALFPRLHLLVAQFPGTLWNGPKHKERMDALIAALGYRRKRDTPQFFAAMYLLTSDKDLYERSYPCFQKSGIRFKEMRLQDISTPNYVLYVAAKSIYAGEGTITLEDLADPEIVDAYTFRLIIHACLIARYGRAVLSLHKKTPL